VIKRLLILNGLAAVCAVINHAVVWELTAMFWWTDRFLPAGTSINPYESVRFFTVGLIDQLVFFAVFAFLFISGFFIAVATGRVQKSLPWRVVSQRVKYLFIPYLLWTVVILALSMLQGRSYTTGELAKIILLGGASPPYYYVILLVQLYILSPLLVPLARHRWKLLLVVTGLLQLLAVTAHYAGLFRIDAHALTPVVSLLQNWHLIGYAFWFVLGMVIGFHLHEFRPSLAHFKWFYLSGMLLTFVIGFMEWSAIRQLSGREWSSPQVTFFNRLFVLFFLLSFVAFENFPIPFSSLFNKLGPKSYGIYLVHVIPLELTARLVYHIAPKLLAYQVIFMPLIILAGVGVPLILMELVNRSFMRPYYKYIFG
jgi:peptidoglycan/LPS O-acetylase OafA/YrhL